MRLCALCVEADLEVGLPLWRREHQIPAVDHCFQHGVRLQTRCQKCRMPFAKAYQLDLPSERCRCGEGLATLEPVSAFQLHVAGFFSALLRGDHEFVAAEQRIKVYRHRLTELGLQSLGDVQRELERVCAGASQAVTEWLTNERQQDLPERSMLNAAPMQTLVGGGGTLKRLEYQVIPWLFRDWAEFTAYAKLLAVSEEPSAQAPIKQPPKYRNRTPSEVETQVLAEIAAGRSLSEASLGCGVDRRYGHYLAERLMLPEAVSCQDLVIPLYESKVSRLCEMVAKGSFDAQIALKLKLPISEVRVIRRVYFREIEMLGQKRQADPVAEAKTSLLAVLRAKPNSSRADMHHLHRQTFCLVMSADPGWLNLHFPPGRAKAERYRRLDEALVNALRAVERNWKEDYPYRVISRKYLQRELGALGSHLRNLKVFPRTAVVVRELVELPEQSFERRLAHARDFLPPGATLSQIRLFAGVSERPAAYKRFALAFKNRTRHTVMSRGVV